jgi:hypothetical protein
MMALSKTAYSASISLALCAAAMAGMQHDVEVSQEGFVQVHVGSAPAQRADQAGGVAGNGVVPYATTPDWQNTLRRQVSSVALGDLNNNGWLDLAAGIYQSNSFPPYESYHDLIHFNTGGALEAQPSWVAAQQVHTGDVRIVDLNHDGYNDLLVGRGGTAMSPSAIYWGTAVGPATTPGWLSTEPGNAWTSNALPVDLDNDGWLEIVTANQGNNEFDPYRPMFQFANVNGVIPTSPVWQSSEQSLQSRIAPADWDGDGWLDVAVSKWANFQSAIYRNNTGVLADTPAWTIGATTTDKGVAWADVDSSGEPDLVVGRGISGTNPAELYTNTGGVLTHTWSNAGNYFGHEDLTFFDVNGDGRPDLVTVHGSARRVNIYLNVNGELPAEPDWTWQNPLFSLATSVAFGDINGDSFADMAVGTTGDISLHVFYAKPPVVICPGDLNADKTVDVFDLLELLGAWGACGDCAADLNDDGVVDVFDLLDLLAAWGDCG